MKFIIGALALAQAVSANTDEKVVTTNKDTWTGSTVKNGDVSVLTSSGETAWREPTTEGGNIFYNMVFKGALAGTDDTWGDNAYAGSWTCLEIVKDENYSCHVITVTKNAAQTII